MVHRDQLLSELLQLVDFHRLLAHVRAVLPTRPADLSAGQQREAFHRRRPDVQRDGDLRLDFLARGRPHPADTKLLQLLLQHHVLAQLHSNRRTAGIHFHEG